MSDGIESALGSAIGIGMLAIVAVSVLDILKERGTWMTEKQVKKDAEKKGKRVREGELDEMVAKGRIKAKKVRGVTYYSSL